MIKKRRKNKDLTTVMNIDRTDTSETHGILINNRDSYFLDVKIVKRIFLLERMNSGYGVPG